MCFTVSIYRNSHVVETDVGALFDASDVYQPYVHVSGFAHPDLPFITSSRPDSIELVSWGLVPSWTKNAEAAADIANKTLNARSETVFEKPSFRSAIKDRRGLLILDGFVEWQHNSSRKQPYYIKPQSESVLLLGGIWEDWLDKSTGEVRRSFSILTTQANTLMSVIHNSKQRMPVVISPKLKEQWLLDNSRTSIESFLAPALDSALEAYPISAEVSRNPVNTDRIEMLEPIGPTIR